VRHAPSITPYFDSAVESGNRDRAVDLRESLLRFIAESVESGS